MSAADIAAVNATFQDYFAAGDLDGLVTLYTEDACFLPPGADVLRGRDAIKGFFQAVRDMGVTAVRLETTEVDDQGDTAIEMGTYALLLDGGAQADHGKFLVSWKKSGGQWRLHRDMINSSMPPAQ